MSGVLKKAPPMPRWHGMPPDLVDQYLAFARRYQSETVAVRISNAECAIRNLGYSREDASDSIRSYRRLVAETTALVAQYERELAALSDVSAHEEGLLQLMEDPHFLGIRVNSAGRLVFHLRVYKEEEGEVRYVGDFEFDLDTLNPNGTLLFVQTDVAGTMSVATTSTDICNSANGIIQSILYTNTRSYWELLRDGDLCGLGRELIKRVGRAAKSKVWLGIESSEPEPAWQGVTPGLERALERTLDHVVRAETKQSLNEAQNNLASYKANQKSYTDKLRSLNRELAETRAELAQLQALSENPTFDEEAARQELRYMTSLPGVMGIRFEDVDSKGLVPVVHVRTTMVYNGQRYDMGDYELVFFRHHGESAAVIETRQTRQANPYNYGGVYYHRTGHAYGCTCCYDRSWFCFGNRARELAHMFEQGDFGTFLHVAINSMNAVNSGDIDDYTLKSYFTRIDKNAVWKPYVATTRRRPRRRWLASVASAVL